MTVTAYPATGDTFSVNRVRQSQLPMPPTQPMTVESTGVVYDGPGLSVAS